MFSRSAALEDHVTEIHQDIIGLSLNFPLLLPLWTPSFLTTQQLPPQLPASGISAEILTGACCGNRKASGNCQLEAPDQTQVPLGSPKKHYSRLLLGSLHARAGGGGEKTQDTAFATVFADMIKESDKHGMWIGDLRANCLIRGKGLHVDLSRAQDMYLSEACIHKPPPQTIHYTIFEQRLAASERDEGTSR
jgi:hypothetical protein